MIQMTQDDRHLIPWEGTVRENLAHMTFPKAAWMGRTRQAFVAQQEVRDTPIMIA